MLKESQLTSIVGGASNNTFQLIYTATYNVVKPDDKTPVIPNKSINAQQFWQSNSGTQLAQNNEANRIYSYLEGQLVNNMITQIAALLPSKIYLKHQLLVIIRYNKFNNYFVL